MRDLLAQLGAASSAAGAAPGAGSLDVAILPAFGTHWLAPRLKRFADLHPDVTVNLSTRLVPFDFRQAPFSAAIHFGRRDWPGAVGYLPLMRERVVAVCAPTLLRGSAEAAALAKLPLLHLNTRPRGWARYLSALGVEGEPAPGPTFDQFSTMAQAAASGLGAALLPTFVAAPFLASGALVRASRVEGESIGTYFLVWPTPEGRNLSEPLASFRDWLSAETPRKIA